MHGEGDALVYDSGRMASLVLMYLGKAQSISVDEADQLRAELPAGNRVRGDIEAILTAIPEGSRVVGDRVRVGEHDYRALYEAISSIRRSGVEISEELVRVQDELESAIHGGTSGFVPG